MHLPAREATGRFVALTSEKFAVGGDGGAGGAGVLPPEPPQPQKMTDSKIMGEFLNLISIVTSHLFALIIVDSRPPLLQMEII